MALHHRSEDAVALGLALLLHRRQDQQWTGRQAPADAKAKALASTVRELQAKGLDTFGAIARELNAQEIPTARGSQWHPTSVRQLLRRLERLEPSSADVPAADE